MGTYRIEAVTGTDANVYTNPYPTLKGKDRVLLPCGRCGGQGTVPGAIVDDVKRGSLISFTGTVTRSRDDASFGFFKRPTGAKLV